MLGAGESPVILVFGSFGIKLKILVLSRYAREGASSRVRYFQYLNAFKEHGFDVEISSLFSNAYVRSIYSGNGRVSEAIKGYALRLPAFLKAKTYDLLIIEKELFPFLPAWFEKFLHRNRIPYIVDYDDALFHRYDLHRSRFIRMLLKNKIDTVMKYASIVIAGNAYLAERAKAAGAQRVEIIPTVVDTRHYLPSKKRTAGPCVVGWIGTPGTSHYLHPLLETFAELRQEFDVRLVAVGAREEDFRSTSIEVSSWSEGTEVLSIQEFDIGIMPLADSPWERGKCGYKLIQCMACAKPVVASPIGVNSEIVESGVNGYLAETPDDWARYLRLLVSDPQLRNTLGAAGRDKVVKEFSLEAQAPRLIGAIERAIQFN